MCIIRSKSELDRSSIVVQTRKGNDISNSQSFLISNFERSQFPHLKRRYSNVIFRSRPTAVYNCHGLTFASKRTGIHETEEVYKILKDDNYKEVSLNEVLPGDIILYFSSDGDIEHSGVIISEPEPMLLIPKVYSKWGKYCEAIHYANMCPYNFSNVRYYRVIE